MVVLLRSGAGGEDSAGAAGTDRSGRVAQLEEAPRIKRVLDTVRVRDRDSRGGRVQPDQHRRAPRAAGVSGVLRYCRGRGEVDVDGGRQVSMDSWRVAGVDDGLVGVKP